MKCATTPPHLSVVIVIFPSGSGIGSNGIRAPVWVFAHIMGAPHDLHLSIVLLRFLVRTATYGNPVLDGLDDQLDILVGELGLALFAGRRE